MTGFDAGIAFIVYFVLACMTVDPLPSAVPAEAQVPVKPTQPIATPRPDLPVMCRQINEWSQQYPSLNPK